MTTETVLRGDAQETTISREIWQRVLPHLTCLQRVLEELTAVFQCHLDLTSFTLYLLDQEAQVLRSVALWNAGPFSSETISVGESVCGQVAQTGVLRSIPDVTKDPEAAGAVSAQARSELVVPLAVGDQILGVVDLTRGQPNAFSREDEDLITSIAGQVASALGYALRYANLEEAVQESEQQAEAQTREIRAERDRASFLYQVTQEMTSTLELERVLNRTLARVSQALGVQQASIMLLDASSGRLIYRAALGRPIALPEGGKQTRYRRGLGLAGWVLEHNECVIINGLDQDSRWDTDPKQRGQSQSALAIPLSAEGDVLGVMLLFHPEPNYFCEDHIQLATAAANHITVAVTNTELYRLIREQAARLGQMLREQRSIASQSMAILASIADGVVVTDESGTITLVNDAVRRVVRGTNRDLVGCPISEVFRGFSGQAQEAVQQAMIEVTERLEDHEQEAFVPVSVKLAREKQVIQASLMRMVDEGQQSTGTVIVLRDVTHEQEIERAKNDIISIVAHELRTPMTSIKGYTDLMLQGAMGTLTEGQQHFLSIVKSNVNRLSQLISDLLDITRIEAGSVKLELVPLQLAEIVPEVCEGVAEAVEERGLTLNVDVTTPLPIVRADRNRIIQVLVNLLSNAYRYTPPGGSIQVSVRPLGNTVLVQIADTGIGIAKEDQRKVFERFYRVDHDLVKKESGTGLGLSIVKSLIELHGGRLWLESELGRGSTFSFALPLATER